MTFLGTLPSKPMAFRRQFFRMRTDHSTSLLFCPTDTAVRNLAAENIARGAHWVDDTMFDAVQMLTPIAERQSHLLANG